MKLKGPFRISSRLLPAVQVGGATIQLECVGTTQEGRTQYRWTIDLPDGSEHSGDDLRSGCGGDTLQHVFESLLVFLSAAAESWNYGGENGLNSYLFPRPVVEWAAQNSDELAMLQCELEETAELISG